jgi:hypothetical protein
MSDGEGAPEHLNIKVTDNNTEVFFKIKKHTELGKLMNAFCDRQGKNASACRFLFDGQRVTAQDTPETVSAIKCACERDLIECSWIWQMVIL